MLPNWRNLAAVLYNKHSVESYSVIHKFSLMVGQWYGNGFGTERFNSFKPYLKHCFLFHAEEFVQAVQSTAGMAVVLLIKSVMGNGDSVAVMVSAVFPAIAND